VLTFPPKGMLERGMSKVKLRNDQWRKIKRYLDETPKVYIGKSRACRRFIEGVLWLTRSGSQ